MVDIVTAVGVYTKFSWSSFLWAFMSGSFYLWWNRAEYFLGVVAAAGTLYNNTLGSVAIKMQQAGDETLSSFIRLGQDSEESVIAYAQTLANQDDPNLDACMDYFNQVYQIGTSQNIGSMISSLISPQTPVNQALTNIQPPPGCPNVIIGQGYTKQNIGIAYARDLLARKRMRNHRIFVLGITIVVSILTFIMIIVFRSERATLRRYKEAARSTVRNVVSIPLAPRRNLHESSSQRTTTIPYAPLTQENTVRQRINQSTSNQSTSNQPLAYPPSARSPRVPPKIIEG
jgi:hypothetical protein